MNQTDVIGDMLTRIRNAGMAGLDTVVVPCSKLKAAVAAILKREGFVRDVVTDGTGGQKKLVIYLKYEASREPVIKSLQRVSRPGRRHYVSCQEMKPVRSGTGIAILSTSRGVLTDREANRYQVGGELICKVW